MPRSFGPFPFGSSLSRSCLSCSCCNGPEKQTPLPPITCSPWACTGLSISPTGCTDISPNPPSSGHSSPFLSLLASSRPCCTLTFSTSTTTSKQSLIGRNKWWWLTPNQGPKRKEVLSSSLETEKPREYACEEGQDCARATWRGSICPCLWSCPLPQSSLDCSTGLLKAMQSTRYDHDQLAHADV